MAELQTAPLIPSTPGTLPSGSGPDWHDAVHRIEQALGWLKDHLIQSGAPGDTSPAQYARSLAETGSVRQAPDPQAAGGMSADVLARAASRTPTNYQQGNPGGASPYLSTDPHAGETVQPDFTQTDKTPNAVGNDRTRQDTSMIGIDHQAVAHKIANWASTLPPAWQKPAAVLATFPADVLASLVEMMSAPESVAMGASTPRGAAAIDAAQTGAGKALGSSGRLAEAISSKLEKPARYLGAWELLRDPVNGTVTIVAPMVGKAIGRELQRAGTALAGDAASPARSLSLAEEAALYKQGYSPKIIESIRQQLRTGGSAAARETVAAPPSSVLPSAARTTPAPAAPAQAPAVTQATKVKLSAEEFDAAQRLVQDGHDPQQVLRAILAQRAPEPSPSGPAAELARRLGTPTDAEMRAAIQQRNATGRWPGERP